MPPNVTNLSGIGILLIVLRDYILGSLFKQNYAVVKNGEIKNHNERKKHSFVKRGLQSTLTLVPSCPRPSRGRSFYACHGTHGADGKPEAVF